jgi:hypothetical protein
MGEERTWIRAVFMLMERATLTRSASEGVPRWRFGLVSDCYTDLETAIEVDFGEDGLVANFMHWRNSTTSFWDEVKEKAKRLLGK